MSLPGRQGRAGEAEGKNRLRETTEDDDGRSEIQLFLTVQLFSDELKDRTVSCRCSRTTACGEDDEKSNGDDLDAEWNEVMNEDSDTIVDGHLAEHRRRTDTFSIGIFDRDVEEKFVNMCSTDGDQSYGTHQQGPTRFLQKNTERKENDMDAFDSDPTGEPIERTSRERKKIGE